MKRRQVYKEVRGLVKDLGGNMFHQRVGYQWGAWIVRLNGRERIFRSNGSGYPELDKLYMPKSVKSNPKHYEDYTNALLSDAPGKLAGMIAEHNNE